jgi:hypothetical protein
MSRVLRSSLVLALATLTVSCASFRNPSIAELKLNPGRYQDHSVNIHGTVTSSWGIPLVPFKFYKVDDGTGEVTVFSQGNRTPTRGARVDVRGKVNEVGVLGGQSLGLHLKEEHISVKRN